MNINDLLDALEKDDGITKAAGETEVKPTEVSGSKSQALEEALTKEASAEEKGRALAVQLLNKAAQAAQTETTEKDKVMDKEAENLADRIAARVMEKLADTPEVKDVNPLTPPAGPHKINEDNAAMVRDHAKRVKPTPGTNGTTQGGSVNQILDSIVSDALAVGASGYDQAAGKDGGEGVDPAIQAAHKIVKGSGVVKEAEDSESFEKAAAVDALINAGLDFDTAVDLVKEAAEEIQSEEDELLKAAAFNELVEEGYDFDEAISLIKDAAKAGAIATAVKKAKGAFGSAKKSGKKTLAKGKKYAEGVKADAKDVPGLAKTLATGRSKEMKGVPKSMQRGTALESLKKNKAVRAGAGVAGAAAIGGAGYAAAKHNEKTAALDELINQGVDFETAADLVIEKAAQIYGGDEEDEAGEDE